MAYTFAGMDCGTSDEEVFEFCSMRQILAYQVLKENIDFTDEQGFRLGKHLTPQKIFLTLLAIQANPKIVYEKEFNPEGVAIPRNYRELKTILNSKFAAKLVEHHAKVTATHVELEKAEDLALEQPLVEVAVVSVIPGLNILAPAAEPSEKLWAEEVYDDVSFSFERNQLRKAGYTRLYRDTVRIPKKAREHERASNLIANNDVFAYSNIFKHYNCDDGSPFEYLIYAPPCSGKSSFNYSTGFGWNDTDHMCQWKSLKQKRVLTNMPHLLKYAKRSLAILPTRCEFERRCRARGLDYQDTWYDDLQKECQEATVVLRTDKMMSDALWWKSGLDPGGTLTITKKEN